MNTKGGAGVCRLRLLVLCLMTGMISTGVLATDITLEMGTAAIDREFEVEVHIDEATDLYGCAFDLVYDPTYVQVVDGDSGQEGVQPLIVEGQVLSEGGTVPTVLLAALEDGQQGTLVIGLTRQGSVSGVTVAADSVLLTVTFRALIEGSTGIEFANTQIEDSAGVPLPIVDWVSEDFDVVDMDPEGDDDGDGLKNAEEEVLGTDPLDADTDDDRLRDGVEDNTLAVLEYPRANACVHTAITDADGIPHRRVIVRGTKGTFELFPTAGSGRVDELAYHLHGERRDARRRPSRFEHSDDHVGARSRRWRYRSGYRRLRERGPGCGRNLCRGRARRRYGER